MFFPFLYSIKNAFKHVHRFHQRIICIYPVLRHKSRVKWLRKSTLIYKERIKIAITIKSSPIKAKEGYLSSHIISITYC